MGNTESTTSRDKRSKRRSKEASGAVERAQKVVGQSVQNLQANLQSQIKQMEENDHPAAHFLDSVCGGYMDDRDDRRGRSNSFYSEDYNSEEEDDDRTFSEDETTTTTDYNGKDRKSSKSRSRRDDPSLGDTASSYQESDYEVDDRKGRKKKASNKSNSFESEDSYSRNDASTNGKVEEVKSGLSKPLASSFAKRCYFTKSGIGSSTQHYEGLTLTGNVVLMLAAAMKLKGCPTICDEDLRRVEQTYPNQFSRLPDELLLSSGWRRISKYCHFSHKPVPDGIPFFHSKQRLHPSGGYYFLLAAAVGMVRPCDVEPLSRDTLVLLETDFPNPCDAAPRMLIEDPMQWTLVDKFCFFSGGPINTDEDVYYQADFDGNPIFMLAFLSPSLTPSELYKLDSDAADPGLKSIAAVEEVESVYDLTERDFDDLRLYHLGPCRALPQYILQPSAWTKVLPPHFVQARETALQRAQAYETATGVVHTEPVITNEQVVNAPHTPQYRSVGSVRPVGQVPPSPVPAIYPVPMVGQPAIESQPLPNVHLTPQPGPRYHQEVPVVEQVALHQPPHHVPVYAEAPPQMPMDENIPIPMDAPAAPPASRGKVDPPEDEPPSLSKRQAMEQGYYAAEEHAFLPDGGNPYAMPGEQIDAYNGLELYHNEPSPRYPSAERTRPSYPQEDYPQEEPMENPDDPDQAYYEEEGHDSYYNVADDNPVEYMEEYRPPHVEIPPEELEYYGPDDVVDDEGVEGMTPTHLSPSELSSRKYEFAEEIETPRGMPPPTPESTTSELSHTSSAMRSAQEMLRRNRQKRLEQAARRTQDTEIESPKEMTSPASEVSGATWESGSEVTSVVSGTSSAWTENSAPERSSRRALILQMAKARMKNNKGSGGSTAGDGIIISPRSDFSGSLPSPYEEEKKLDTMNETGTDIDIAGDLD